MIQDKLVRARRQYHHHHHHSHQHHHQQQQSADSNSTHQQHHNRHALSHSHRSNKRSHVPNAPSNTTQFIMNDHELIEPDFDLMHNAIMEHYNRSKRRKLQNQASDESSSNHTSMSSPDKVAAKSATDCGGAMKSPRTSSHRDESLGQPQHRQMTTASAAPTIDSTTTTTTSVKSPLKDLDDEETKNQQPRQQQQQQQSHVMQQLGKQTTPTTTAATTTTTTNNNNTTTSGVNQGVSTTPAHTTQLQESTNQSNPTTPNYRPMTGSPGDEDGLSPFINHEHLQSEFQEVYANIHTERLSSMSKNQLVDKYLLLEERVEELENQLRESQTAASQG